MRCGELHRVVMRSGGVIKQGKAAGIQAEDRRARSDIQLRILSNDIGVAEDILYRNRILRTGESRLHRIEQIGQMRTLASHVTQLDDPIFGQAMLYAQVPLLSIRNHEPLRRAQTGKAIGATATVRGSEYSTM